MTDKQTEESNQHGSGLTFQARFFGPLLYGDILEWGILMYRPGGSQGHAMQLPSCLDRAF